ncbi:MAG: hypothetical protein ACREVN_03545 [Gammaproteobacteria bacterium]
METLKLELSLPEPGPFVPRHVGATPMAAGFSAAAPAARTAVVEEVAEQLSRYEVENGIRIPFRSLAALAEKSPQ